MAVRDGFPSSPAWRSQVSHDVHGRHGVGYHMTALHKVMRGLPGDHLRAGNTAVSVGWTTAPDNQLTSQ